MRGGRDDVLDAEASGYVAAAVKLRIWGETGACAGVCIGKAGAGQFLARCTYIVRICREISEFALETCCPGKERSISKGPIDAAEVERAYDAAWGDCGD